jgi:large-conductance mechanosensitive channel
MTDIKSDKETVKITANGQDIHIETPKNRAGLTPNFNIFTTPKLVSDPVDGFVSFIKENAVVSVAVGFAIGSQAQPLVKSIITSFIEPAYKLIFGSSLATQKFTVSFADRSEAFVWGAVAQGLLNFLFFLAAIYLIVKLFKLDKFKKDDTKKKKAKK